MQKNRIPQTVLGLLLVMLVWILELLALDWMAIQLFDGALLYRALANLVGSAAGLFAFGWAFRSLVGSLLGLPGEPWSVRLRRFFRMPWSAGKDTWVITTYSTHESLRDIDPRVIAYQERTLLEPSQLRLRRVFGLPWNPARDARIVTTFNARKTLPPIDVRVIAIDKMTFFELPGFEKSDKYSDVDFKPLCEHQAMTGWPLEGLDDEDEFTRDEFAIPHFERAGP